MATGTGRNAGAAAIPTASRSANGLPVSEGGDALGGVGSGSGSDARSDAGSSAGVLSPIVEVSDKDYRSFCFPCHALEEVTDCNAGY
jgi:hypothetical protein